MKRGLLWSAVALMLIAFAAPLGAQEFPDMTPVKPRPAGPPPNAIVEQPRPFGHVIGDVLTQRVLLQLDGQPFTPGPLPRAERVGTWLERRALKTESTDDGRHWLIAEFQIVNAPEALAATIIPAWELRPASGQNTLRMPAWPISIAPLTPRTVFGDGALAELRPDRPAPPIATEPIERQLTLYGGLCAATIALWLAWWLWRQWRATSSQPFARAQRTLRRLDDSAPQAWLALHRAFDETAGEALQTATLGDLFKRAPQLLPLRDRIEGFFAQSNARFFGTGLPVDPLPVRKLCAELRRIEKRHEA
jgi:mxaA protein